METLNARFSIFCTFFPKFDSDQLKELISYTTLDCNSKKKIFSSGASTQFLEKNVLYFFHTNQDLKLLIFTFFVLLRLIFQILFLPS